MAFNPISQTKLPMFVTETKKGKMQFASFDCLNSCYEPIPIYRRRWGQSYGSGNKPPWGLTGQKLCVTFSLWILLTRITVCWRPSLHRRLVEIIVKLWLMKQRAIAIPPVYNDDKRYPDFMLVFLRLIHHRPKASFARHKPVLERTYEDVARKLPFRLLQLPMQKGIVCPHQFPPIHNNQGCHVKL